MKTPFPKYDEALVQAIEEELDQVHLTEITHRGEMWNFTSDGERYEKYTLLTARGSYLADIATAVTPRMMIQSIETETRRGGVICTDPCAACDNFAISWKCDVHPELPYDSEKKRWGKPATQDDPFDGDRRILNDFTDGLDASSTNRERITALGAYLERLAELEVDE